jgi:hypothetical protein
LNRKKGKERRRRSKEEEAPYTCLFIPLPIPPDTGRCRAVAARGEMARIGVFYAVVDGRGLKELKLSPQWLRLSGRNPRLAPKQSQISNLLTPRVS